MHILLNKLAGPRASFCHCSGGCSSPGSFGLWWERHAFGILNQRVSLSFTIKTFLKLITTWLFTTSYLYTYPCVLLQHTHPKAGRGETGGSRLLSYMCYKGWGRGGSRNTDPLVRGFCLRGLGIHKELEKSAWPTEPLPGEPTH